MISTTNDNFREAIEVVEENLLTEGEIVDTTSWQAKSSPEYRTLEIQNISFTVPVPSGIEKLQEDILPNLPWAEIAFKERIGGKPTNPGEAYKSWPYYKEERGMREVEGAEPQFSHTYQERYWCPAKSGIRYAWGNLNSVIKFLIKDPLTRQANFPIWFPEDTGAGGDSPRRVPCSLNYYFICRNNQLNIFYDIRSCDYLRHLADDIYLTARLLQWVLGRLRRNDLNGFWRQISLGTLTMHIYSLHCFVDDIAIMNYRRGLRGEPEIKPEGYTP